MKKAPDFSLADQNGTVHTLNDYKGKWLVLYFYPKDDTPGCTVEACSFRDGRDDLAELGAEVVGVSKDSVASHKKFADKHGLTFTLLSDESTEMLKAYDAWGPKKFMGRAYEGITRKTYIINPDGQIVREYPKVTPAGHAKAIVKDLSALQAEASSTEA
jgi:thioredoxin-dependent peroxiredoxin